MDKRIQAQMAKMDQQQELLLARLLTEEAQQLTERAKTNKRAQEDELWEQRALQRAREAKSSRHRSPSPSATSSSTSSSQGPSVTPSEAPAGVAPAKGLHEDEVQSWLAARRVRGRGGVGSLADEVGPWAEEADGLPMRVQGVGSGAGEVVAAAVVGRAKKDKRKKDKSKDKSKKKKKKKKSSSKKRRRASPGSV